MASRSARPTRPTRRSSRGGVKETTGSLLRFIAGVAILAWFLRSFILQPFYIPSGSMLPSLYVGDYLVVAKWPYGYSRYSFPLGIPRFNGRLIGGLPDRGDVVVFRHPSGQSDLIKRVIGLPGDTVEVRRGRLILNGRPVDGKQLDDRKVPLSLNSPCRVAPGVTPKIADVGGSKACVYQAFLETLPGGRSYEVLSQLEDGPADNFPRTRVPGGHLFVMGDNRDDSLDSRYPTDEGGVGMLPIDNVVGKAEFTFWSTDGSASYLKPWTWFTALRADRIGNGYTGRPK